VPPPNNSPAADELLSKKAHREWLQSYDERCGGAVDFMRCVRPVLDVESGALRDPSAPTQAELDPGMQALVVSRETLAGGEAINRGRVARGFPQLRLVVVGVVGERPDGSKLSSSELRERDAVDSSRRSSGSSDGGGIAR
jgi:pantetheine-phosphate adenylyltransferase